MSEETCCYEVSGDVLDCDVHAPEGTIMSAGRREIERPRTENIELRRLLAKTARVAERHSATPETVEMALKLYRLMEKRAEKYFCHDDCPFSKLADGHDAINAAYTAAFPKEES